MDDLTASIKKEDETRKDKRASIGLGVPYDAACCAALHCSLPMLQVVPSPFALCVRETRPEPLLVVQNVQT